MAERKVPSNPTETRFASQEPPVVAPGWQGWLQAS